MSEYKENIKPEIKKKNDSSNELNAIPKMMADFLSQNLQNKQVVIDAFGVNAHQLFEKVHRIQIITSNTSYYVGLMARYWLEEIAGIPCQIETAMDYIKRTKIVESNKLCVILSKSGEEVEILAALKMAQDIGYVAIFSISNIADSTTIRESDLSLLTQIDNVNGEEHFNETKTLVAQLTGLFLLAIALGRYHRLNKRNENNLVSKLEALPEVISDVLSIDIKIKDYSSELNNNEQAVYLGRDIQFPIALEGAHAMKEQSGINAVARIPEEFMMSPFRSLTSSSYRLPVVALAPSYDLFDQWRVNFQQFARQDFDVFVISDKKFDKKEEINLKILPMPTIDRVFSPIIYSIPLQLLAFHVYVNK